MKKLLFLIAIMLLLAGTAKAANSGVRQNIRTLEPVKTATPPVLDGSWTTRSGNRRHGR